MYTRHNYYLLGIDIGTTTIKSVIFDFKGNEIAKASHETSNIHPKPGWSENSMTEIWEAVVQSIKKAIYNAKIKSEEIKGISLCAQGGGAWLINNKGEPIINAINWLDGRAGYIVDKWRENKIFEKLLKLSGLTYWPGAGPGIIFPWLMENDPKIFEDTKVVFWAKDWVRYCLTGEMMTDETDPLGMLDLNNRRYSSEVINATGIEDLKNLLPPVKKSFEMGGKISKFAADVTGLKEGTPVAVGAWDCASTAIGQGCVEVNDVFSIIGTAGIHMLVTDKPVVNKAYSLSCYSVPNQYLVHSMAMTATNNLDWFVRELCFEENKEAVEKELNIHQIIAKKVANIPIGANGIFFLPFLQGERAPFVEPTARAEFVGIGDWSTKDELLRSIFEGVALATLHNYKAIENAESFKRVRLGGGGAKNEVWVQIISDCTGKSLEVTSGSEYGARGAAINAALMLGIYSSYKEAVDNMVKVKKIYEPNLKNTEIYKEIFDIYVKLIDSHLSLWKEINKLVIEKLHF
jgi:sugar (pentulose or hexulose) kinase